MRVALVLATIFVCTLAAEIKECFPTKDGKGCSEDECCIPEMEFFKVSKRDLMPPDEIKPMFPWGNRQGRCIKYFAEGENCYSMASWQTCGCTPGLQCQYTPHPDEIKRAIPPWARPKGTHACVNMS